MFALLTSNYINHEEKNPHNQSSSSERSVVLLTSSSSFSSYSSSLSPYSVCLAASLLDNFFVEFSVTLTF